MSDAPTAEHWIHALRASQDRLTGLAAHLDDTAVEGPSYDDGWTLAQVFSHLGSQAEIMDLFLEAGLNGEEAPGIEDFHPVWDVWNAKAPTAMRDDSVAANEKHLARLEAMDDRAREAWTLRMFGSPVDLVGFVRMRLSEHAVHTWDIEVMSDPAATVVRPAVELLLDQLGATAARGGRPAGESFRVRVGTTSPAGAYVVDVSDAVRLAPAEADDRYDGSVDLTAENLVRLVFGRLDGDHTGEHSESGGRGLADLRAVFPGF